MPTKDSSWYSIIKKILDAEAFLSGDPAQAITGTVLVEKIKSKLVEQGKDEPPADNTIIHYISRLAHEEDSPISKVDKGFGYYSRKTQMEDSSKKADSKKGIDDQSEEKFRALYIRYQIADGGYPVRISHSKAQKGKKGDATWKFPDVVVLKPSVEGLERIEDKEDVDFSPFLNLMPLFGKPPLVVSSVELKVTPMTAQLRSYFFEAVSNSMWAQKPLLVFAYSADAQSASELRRLGASYGVTVQTFGLKRNALDNLPSANEIRNWAPEKAREWVEQNSEGIDTLSSPPERPGLDWEHLLDLIVSTGTPFKDVLTWIQKCLTDGKPCHYEEWEKTNKKKKVF